MWPPGFPVLANDLPMLPTNARRLAVCLAAASLLAACGDDGAPSSGDTGAVDSGAVDTGTDDTGTGDADASDTGSAGDLGSDEDSDAASDTADADTTPVYVPAACEDRTPVNGPTTIVPPACDYEVPYVAGLVGIVESCGSAVDVPEGLHLTWPAEDAGSTVAVLWSTPNATRESVVRVGDTPETLDRVFWGYNFTYTGLTNRVLHEVHLCGLEPGRTYYYQAGGEGAWSDVHSFATAPAAGSDDEIVFALTGDTRSETFEMWGDVVQRVRDLGAEFIVFSGDAVEAGPVQSEWDLFFEQGQPGLAEMPIIPANGNHDLLLSTWYGQFALGNDEVNAVVRYGDLVFAAMTDFYFPDQGAIADEFAAYLDDAYTRHADAPWKFLVNHRAFYSSSNHGSMDDLQQAWGPIVDEHELAVVFNGHDHNYERSKPIRAGEVAVDGQGTVYTVVAGIGAPLYDNGTNWWTEVSEKVASFAIIRIQGGTLQYTAYRADGTTLDAFTLER